MSEQQRRRELRAGNDLDGDCYPPTFDRTPDDVRRWLNYACSNGDYLDDQGARGWDWHLHEWHLWGGRTAEDTPYPASTYAPTRLSDGEHAGVRWWRERLRAGDVSV